MKEEEGRKEEFPREENAGKAKWKGDSVAGGSDHSGKKAAP